MSEQPQHQHRENSLIGPTSESGAKTTAHQSAPDVRLELSAGQLSTELVEATVGLGAEAQRADGAPPFSEQTLVALRRAVAPLPPQESPGVVVAAAWSAEAAAEQLAGAAVVVLGGVDDDGAQVPHVLELTVHPLYRRAQIGTGLAELLRTSAHSPDHSAAALSVDAPVRAWAHGDHPGAPQLARHFGFSPVRELWRMRLENSVSILKPAAPEGLQLRSFLPGQDDQAWLELNAAAFADHPEQGQLRQPDLQARIESAWFSAEGFLLAEDAGQLLGFHWTKIEPGQQGETLGEVYAVGVSPQAQGRGLGAWLTAAGIEHLRAQGVDAIILYVDAGNTAAAELYKKLGFTVWDIDTQYAPQQSTE